MLTDKEVAEIREDLRKIRSACAEANHILQFACEAGIVLDTKILGMENKHREEMEKGE